MERMIMQPKYIVVKDDCVYHVVVREQNATMFASLISTHDVAVARLVCRALNEYDEKVTS
jgi:hypothetical protein